MAAKRFLFQLKQETAKLVDQREHKNMTAKEEIENNMIEREENDKPVDENGNQIINEGFLGFPDNIPMKTPKWMSWLDEDIRKSETINKELGEKRRMA